MSPDMVRKNTMVTVSKPFTVRHVIAGSLPCIGTRLVHGDMADPDWFTHGHRGCTHSEDPESMLYIYASKLFAHTLVSPI